MEKKENHRVTLATIVSLVLVFILAVSNFAFAAKPDRTPPTAPANLRAATITDTSATLSWDASKDNVGVKSYDIYKNNIYLSSTASTTYTVNGLSPATAYKFYIKAKDARGNLSPSSNIITVNTASSTIPSGSSTKIVGYYAAWAAYSGYKPDRIDATKLTLSGS